jgi:hypothetical protein
VSNDLGIYTELGAWFNLRVEYYPAGKDNTLAFIYINGSLAAVSTNYYGPRVDGVIPEPSSEVRNAYFMTLNAADVDFYVDNIVFEKSDQTATLPERTYDFEGSEELPLGVTVNGGDVGLYGVYFARVPARCEVNGGRTELYAPIVNGKHLPDAVKFYDIAENGGEITVRYEMVK